MLTATNNLPAIASNINSFNDNFLSNSPVLTAARNGLSEMEISKTIKPTTYSNNRVIIEYAGENITSIDINGVSYYLSNEVTPSIGYFYINEETNEIIVNTGYDTGGLTAILTTISPVAKLNRITNIPLLFKRYLVVGDFSFSQSFEGHPNGRFSIRYQKTEYNAIRNALKPGTPLNLQGIDYRVRSLSRVKILDGLGHELLNIQLQGYWERMGNTTRSPLDQPIREKELVDIDNCGFEYSYKTALDMIGVSLRSGNITKKVSRDISSSQTITARQLLEDRQRLLVYGYYVDWSSRLGPTLRRWDSPATFRVDVVNLSQAQQYPTITISENGTGTMLNGCYLSHELNNVELKLDQDPNGLQDGDEEICLVQGDRNPTEPPEPLVNGVYGEYDYEKLRSPLTCFDNGERKKRITRCQLNGSDIEVTEEEYGWVFTSVDVYDFRVDNEGNVSYVFKTLTDILLNVSWQLVKFVKTQFIYDKTTGYYLNKVGSGWELTRDLKETEDKEAIQLSNEISTETDPDAIANLERHLNGYTNFYRRTIKPSELFELDDLSEYYPDLAKNDESDDNFIPSLYPKVSDREEDASIVRPDPRSTVDEPQPDLIIGSKSRETQRVEINSTSPEKFLTWNPVTNQEGTNLNETAFSESFTENSGRPGLQPRLNKRSGCFNRKKDDRGSQPQYTVSTPGVTVFNTITQSLTYPGAYTINQAIAACTLDYKIKNSKDSCTLELPIGEPLKGLKMGDIVIFDNQRWRVFGYNQSGNIQVDGGYYSNITLNLGKDVDLGLTRKTI